MPTKSVCASIRFTIFISLYFFILSVCVVFSFCSTSSAWCIPFTQSTRIYLNFVFVFHIISFVSFVFIEIQVSTNTWYRSNASYLHTLLHLYVHSFVYVCNYTHFRVVTASFGPSHVPLTLWQWWMQEMSLTSLSLLFSALFFLPANFFFLLFWRPKLRTRGWSAITLLTVPTHAGMHILEECGRTNWSFHEMRTELQGCTVARSILRTDSLVLKMNVRSVFEFTQ